MFFIGRDCIGTVSGLSRDMETGIIQHEFNKQLIIALGSCHKLSDAVALV